MASLADFFAEAQQNQGGGQSQVYTNIPQALTPEEASNLAPSGALSGGGEMPTQPQVTQGQGFKRIKIDRPGQNPLEYTIMPADMNDVQQAMKFAPMFNSTKELQQFYLQTFMKELPSSFRFPTREQALQEKEQEKAISEGYDPRNMPQTTTEGKPLAPGTRAYADVNKPAKPTPIPGEQLAKIADLQAFQEKIAELGASARSYRGTGPVLGTAGKLPYVGEILQQKLDPAGVDQRALIADLTTTLTSLRSGAAVSAQEFERLRGMLPAETDTGEALVTKVKRLEVEIGRTLEKRQAAFGSEAGYKPSPSTEKAPTADEYISEIAKRTGMSKAAVKAKYKL